MSREIIRATAGRLLRSDPLAVNEKEIASELLRNNPAFGNPHMVRCEWCHETTMLFRDEDRVPFKRTLRGWRCEACGEHAASQEVRF
jgi:formylmethanofuran dehydrogenase subunit E